MVIFWIILNNNHIYIYIFCEIRWTDGLISWIWHVFVTLSRLVLVVQKWTDFWFEFWQYALLWQGDHNLCIATCFQLNYLIFSFYSTCVLYKRHSIVKSVHYVHGSTLFFCLCIERVKLLDLQKIYSIWQKWRWS